jgi:transcriptional regulator with XRE-family HTH domain
MQQSLTFGTWLRQARIARDLTQEALAEQVGCSTQTVRAFESGRRRPSREMAVRLAAILELSQPDGSAFVRLARAPQSAPKQAIAVTAQESFATAVSTAPPTSRPSIVLPSDALIGRHDDLLHLRVALLDDQRRLVTLLGPGGIGKTRLALQLASDLAPHFHDGVAFVTLAPVADAANVVTAIAEVVDCPLPAAQSPEAALIAFLRERAMLLVLDNLEHLLGVPHGSHVSAAMRHRCAC